MEFSNEKKRLESGCGAVLQGMAGKKVFVELRNDVYVIGILESCDSNLDIRIQYATIIRDAQKTEEPEYLVIGKHVRFVHFEHQVVPIAAIRRCMKGDQTGRPKQNRRLDQKQFDTGRKIVDQ
ncbi:Sm domain-containing protein [Caenorhabditis elegans]|uniref:Sm domain-containing protein n=1 Tax=Caenorhabditis elegans TaxID=6239 RepID=Q7YWY5_CAEEL|nr:Sm domain-containing protein [Caenorhabditis elegans]CAE17865.1 Sm domain-containing protein [Caenorhabditis elegans]|eukprot:NP_001021551.1 Uncharacterized protein CELE_K07A1.15 [Caenorhabditis elegans]